ncbi:MAG: ThuA domain-containing protein [Chitinophagaceae bacterium]
MRTTAFVSPFTIRKLCLFIFLMVGLSLSRCKVHSSVSKGGSKPIRTLIVGGGSSHDFNRWYKQADAETLSRDGFATVTYISNPDSMMYFLPATDVLYLCFNQPINNPVSRKAILDFIAAGKGLVLGHAALWYNWKDWPEYNIEVVSGGTRGHDRYGSFEVNIVNESHPVTKGVQKKFTLKDELYRYELDPKGPGIEVLATANVAGSDRMSSSVFVVKNSKARIVGIALGHDAESHNIPEYQTLLRNAVQWVARR